MYVSEHVWKKIEQIRTEKHPLDYSESWVIVEKVVKMVEDCAVNGR